MPAWGSSQTPLGIAAVAWLLVRILLPPSEGKAVGGRGRPLSSDPRSGGPLPGDSRACLVAGRTRALESLAQLVAGDAAEAAKALVLPPGLVDDALAADTAVCTTRTMLALQRYRGVVYDGLNFDGLTPAAQRLARRTVLIFSGLFGVVRGGEFIPRYRVPAKAHLPGIGIAGTYWRPILAGIVPSMLGTGLIVDLRSGDYAAMWRPGPGLPNTVIAVRILSPKPSGGFAVVSYPSKLAKGQLAAALLERECGAAQPTTIDDVTAAWAACGGAGSNLCQQNQLDLFTH